MFEFEKLTVYQKSKEFDKNVIEIINRISIDDRVIIQQLKRASLSIPLNIAEGTGRLTKPDRKNFYVIARGSAYECAAIFDILKYRKYIEEDMYTNLYNQAEALSMMLFAMIKKLE